MGSVLSRAERHKRNAQCIVGYREGSILKGKVRQRSGQGCRRRVAGRHGKWGAQERLILNANI